MTMNLSIAIMMTAYAVFNQHLKGSEAPRKRCLSHPRISGLPKRMIVRYRALPYITKSSQLLLKTTQLKGSMTGKQNTLHLLTGKIQVRMKR